MKILIVASDKGDKFVPFIEEQIAALLTCGVQIARYGITGKGIVGYLRELPALKRMIRTEQPDIIHAHYGLSGLLANLQRKIPVVTTYHGSDINVPKLLRLSKISMCLSIHNIFVSKRNISIARPNRKFSLLPCGVNLTDDQLYSRSNARKMLGIDENAIIVLFAGAFNNTVKDAHLAQSAVLVLNQRFENVKHCNNLPKLVELKGFNRHEVNQWMCAANCLLMTSKTEGSPQVIKEAMACECPIVCVDVGDVAERVSGVEGCYVVRTREPKDIAKALQQAIDFEGKTNGRERIIEMGLSNEQVAKRLMEVYEEIGR